MIDYLNNILHHLFMVQINQITDEAWRTQVQDLQRNALNVLLLGEKETSDCARTSGGAVSCGPLSGSHPRAIPISSV
jgi:hypothetical protein